VIFVSVGPAAIFYRALTPRWVHDPASGAGAAKVSGRFNAAGVQAHYLSQEPEIGGLLRV